LDGQTRQGLPLGVVLRVDDNPELHGWYFLAPDFQDHVVGEWVEDGMVLNGRKTFGGVDTPLLQATPDMGRKRWILILCAWTIVGLLFAVRRIMVVQLQGTHVSWVIRGCSRICLLVRMGGVQTACDWSG
jgi:hypothetical protein